MLDFLWVNNDSTYYLIIYSIYRFNHIRSKASANEKSYGYNVIVYNIYDLIL